MVRPTEVEALAFMRAYSPTDLRKQAELLILERDFVPGLRKNPKTAAMLDAYPKLGPELVKAMASQIDVYIEEYDARYYRLAAAIVRKSLSRDEVLELTAFFNSAQGKKMLSMAARNVDGTEILERAAKQEKVDSGVMERQAFRSGIMTFANLTDEERARILAMAQSTTGKHLQATLPELHALGSDMTNHPGPRFAAGSKKALAEAFKRVTGLEFGKKE